MEQTLKIIKAREEELKQFNDYDKRHSLFLSWLGQADRCIRKGNLQDPYYHALFKEWIKKVEMLLDGRPLEECKGKVKVKGKKPMKKKQKLKWKVEHKKEIQAYRNNLQAQHIASQKNHKETKDASTNNS